MVVKHECPHCRQDIWVRKALDNKHYIWDMSREQEVKEGFIPFDDREELKRFYRDYRRGTAIRKRNWLADQLDKLRGGDPNE
jgi:hypothetical protein